MRSSPEDNWRSPHGPISRTTPSIGAPRGTARERDLADRLLAPFNWPDAQVLKNTIEAAGFHQTQVRSKALPLIFESGIAQAARALEATPLAPSLATLPEGTQLKLKAAIGANLAPLLRDGKVSANMTSNIAVART